MKIEDRDYDLWLLLARTHYRVKQARTNELRNYGISPEQAGILFYVQNNKDNAKPSDLARWMLREPQTITSNINGMVKKGLIKKTQDKIRKNVVRLSLTEKGEKAYVQSIKRDSFHRILAVLTEEQRQALLNTLHDLLRSVQIETQEYHHSESESD
jgi:DNA-binding MarR family transcriptional regulator